MGCPTVPKRYYILCVSLHDWISSAAILSTFERNYGESPHLMGILTPLKHFVSRQQDVRTFSQRNLLFSISYGLKTMKTCETMEVQLF